MKIGIYLRLSREDENFENESNSITNQREYIYNFIKSNNIKYDKIFEYKDDGVSGTTFKRQGLTNLLEDTNNGKINCIIVKDLSRFGRNYIETTEYIENIFPLLNVRFIAINDNYDSFNDDNFNNYFNLNFKNILYSYYSKDLSKKVKTAGLNKAKTGKIPTSSAPYGYIISNENKHKFEIDKNTYKVVENIFNMACNGKNFTEIAKFLNENNIETPLEYKINKGKIKKLGKCKGKLFWKSLTVRNILKNEVYTGKRIYGKTEIKDVGTRNYKNIDKEKWVVFENYHPAIVSKEIFEKAQKIFKGNRELRKTEENIFKNVLKCGYCGYNLQKINKKDVKYTCNTLRYTNEYDCKYFMIKEDDIKRIILTQFLTQIQLLNENEIDFNFNLKEIEKELINIKKYKDNLYNSYLKEEINKEMYIQEKNLLIEKEEKLNTQKNNITSDKILDCVNFIKNKGITKDFVEDFIKEIVIFDNNTIYIYFNYRVGYKFNN